LLSSASGIAVKVKVALNAQVENKLKRPADSKYVSFISILVGR
jgi:uncharacterized membrane protein YdcZ (DUF606 family)